MGEPQFNPFTVVSPEKLTADQVMKLFVEMPSELNQVMDPGHMMIVGARGAGKSMIFRYLLPDVQTRLCDGKYKQIPFLAFHIPIKNAQLHLPELAQLDNAHAAALINEHFLVLYCLIIVLKDITEVEWCNLDELSQKDLEMFVNNCFLDGLFACGCNAEIKYEGQSGGAIFGLMYRYALRLHSDFLRFVVGTKPGMSGGDIHYDLPLLSYHNEFDFFAKDMEKTEDCINKILDAVPRGSNRVIVPMNSKISTIACARIAITHPDVQLCYAQPEAYNITSYSTVGNRITLLNLFSKLPVSKIT